jgi:Tfp pilus assembly protein PilN
VNGVNLIPIARRQARRRAARIRAWMIVAPLCASLLGGAYAGLRVQWGGDGKDLTTDLASADALIRATEREISAAKLKNAELQPMLRAARAVGNQPDWGQLLTLLASKLGEHAVLSNCTLTPAPDAATPASPAPRRTGRAGEGSKPQDFGRPERFTLTLSGIGRTQDAVASFISALETAGLFDRVTLQETHRTNFAAQEAVAFKVECLLSDPITEAP